MLSVSTALSDTSSLGVVLCNLAKDVRDHLKEESMCRSLASGQIAGLEICLLVCRCAELPHRGSHFLAGPGTSQAAGVDCSCNQRPGGGHKAGGHCRSHAECDASAHLWPACGPGGNLGSMLSNALSNPSCLPQLAMAAAA